MKIIDMHVHTLECGIMCGGKVDASFKAVSTELDKYNINKAVLMPINDISWQPVKKMNDYLVEIVKKNKEFIGFIDIDITKMHLYNGIIELENEIILYNSKGLKGVKIHLQNLGVKADDWRLIPIYRIAGELGIPVTIHCYPGSSPGLHTHSDPVSIEKMVRVFHKTTFIIAHFGGVKYFDDMKYLNYDNVYFETSGVLPILKKHLGIEKMKIVFEEIGFDKIMFASDYPTESIKDSLEIIQEIVADEYIEDVLYYNAYEFGKRFKWWAIK